MTEPTDDAVRRYPTSWEDRGRTDRDDERAAFVEGWEAGVAAERERLLSDAAVEAAVAVWWAHPDVSGGPDGMRAALAAAIRTPEEPVCACCDIDPMAPHTNDCRLLTPEGEGSRKTPAKLGEHARGANDTRL